MMIFHVYVFFPIDGKDRHQSEEERMFTMFHPTHASQKVNGVLKLAGRTAQSSIVAEKRIQSSKAFPHVRIHVIYGVVTANYTRHLNTFLSRQVTD